jgi:3-(3-hydroxy-phenyl)propionate hydroxylase
LTTHDPTPLHDVAIVGYGPIGAALARALGLAGLDVQVVERGRGVSPQPRAIHLDGEAMRVIDGLGLAAQALPVLHRAGGTAWVDAAGQTLLERAGRRGLGLHGWHDDYYFHQPDLEAVLRLGVAQCDTVQVHEGMALDRLDDDGEAVTLHLVSAQGEGAFALRARVVVGCDGARSTVRAAIGADDFEDLGAHQSWLVVDALLPRPLDLPDHAVQHCDPARPAVSIPVSPLRHRWEVMLLPGEDAQAMATPAQAWALLGRWVRPGQATLERVAAYTFHALVARHWRRGRVLLAGDAAHQMPPFLGQGLCAGLRDVANLAWKLPHALRHPAEGEALLDSYGSERAAHVREFIALADSIGRLVQETDPDRAAARDERLARQGLTFEFPAPALGAGLHGARRTAPDVGHIAPQFENPDGHWTDSLAGARWSVWLEADLTAHLPGVLRERLQGLDIALIDEPGTKARVWLAERRACAVILRPDRYIYDLCAQPRALAESLDALAERLGHCRLKASGG